MIEGIDAALARAQQGFKISSRLIASFLRHLDAASAVQTLDAALPHRDRIAAVGLDSSEKGHPPEKFAAVFARRAQAEFRRSRIRARRAAGLRLRQALDLRKVSRIDHGVRSEEKTRSCWRIWRRRACR